MKTAYLLTLACLPVLAFVPIACQRQEQIVIAVDEPAVEPQPEVIEPTATEPEKQPELVTIPICSVCGEPCAECTCPTGCKCQLEKKEADKFLKAVEKIAPVPRVQAYVFTMENCRHCVTYHNELSKRLGPTLRMGDELNADVRFVHYEHDPELFTKHGVKACPMTLFVVDGKEKSRVAGVVSADYVRQRISELRKAE